MRRVCLFSLCLWRGEGGDSRAPGPFPKDSVPSRDSVQTSLSGHPGLLGGAVAGSSRAQKSEAFLLLKKYVGAGLTDTSVRRAFALHAAELLISSLPTAVYYATVHIFHIYL